MFHFQKLRHNTETHKTDLLYSPHHIGQYSSVKLHEARPLVLLNLPGETLVKNSKTHGTSSNINKPLTYVNCTRRFTICNSNRHISETSYKSCRTIPRETGIDRRWPERKKMSEEERETKISTSCRYASTQTESNWLLRKGEAASKSYLLGRWKTQSALRDATFLLPSVSCRVLRSRVLILFLNFKLENVAIKLVEIALEKHKFPNVFVKKGKFGQKKHCCLLHR